MQREASWKQSGSLVLATIPPGNVNDNKFIVGGVTQAKIFLGASTFCGTYIHKLYSTLNLNVVQFGL